MKRTIIALAAVLAVFLGMPAAAETFTSSDGVFSIDLPSDEWKAISDHSKLISLSDGGNVITVEHYSNGEKLPDMAVADDHYVNVYQAVYSTQNEVFIITGSVVDKENITEVVNAIASAKVLKYDTKKAVTKSNEQPKASELTIVSMSKTMYVTADNLNVRSGCSTDDQIIGSFSYGSEVKVLGSVQRDGKDIGWYQVAYENTMGYVSAEFLSDQKPDGADDKDSSITYTGVVKTVYDEEGNAFTLYEATNGFWYDNDGTAYTQVSDTEFQVYEGTKRVSVIAPTPEPTSWVTVYDEEGTAYTLYQGSDGLWYDDYGSAYTQVSDTEFQAYEGMRRLSIYPPTPDTDPEPTSWVTAYDEEGTAYTLYQGSDGLWYDNYGSAYTQVSDTEFQAYEGMRRLSIYPPTPDTDPEPTQQITVEDEAGNVFPLFEGSDGYWYDSYGNGYDFVEDGELQSLNGTKRVSVV